MSTSAARILVIVCREESYIDLLIEQWPDIHAWCGFLTAHGPVAKKHHKALLVLIWGGQLQPSQIPDEVESIGICNTADFPAVKAMLWPEDYKNQKDHNTKIAWIFGQAEAAVI